MSGAPQVVAMGEILIDMIAQPKGRKLEDTESFVPKPGGAPANVAVALAKLDCPAAFVGMTGDDAFGRLLRNTLNENQVDTRALASSSTQPTTLAFVAIDSNGVPDFVFYRHPNADLSITADDVDWKVFEDAKVFHFGSLSLTAPPASTTTRACLEHATKQGIFVSYDPNYRPALWESEDAARKAMLAPLSSVHLLKVSEEELQLLSGEIDLEKGCAALSEKGPRHVMVTRGSDGIFAWIAGETLSVPGKKVDAVDTTGCGDSSMAGTLASLLEQGVIDGPGSAIPVAAFERALAFANRCAAHTATGYGAIPALPTRADLAK